MRMVNIGNSWDGLLADVFASENYLRLREFLKEEYSRHTVYPDMHDIFNALRYTPYESVKAVILGSPIPTAAKDGKRSRTRSSAASTRARPRWSSCSGAGTRAPKKRS